MNKKRLLKLAKFLREKVPDDAFEMGLITGLDDDVPTRALPAILEECLATKEQHCGAAACAIGWSPAVFPDDLEWDGEGAVVLTSNRRLKGFDAAEKFYDLTEMEAYYLFSPDAYGIDGSEVDGVEGTPRCFLNAHQASAVFAVADISRKTVAKRIEQFVAKGLPKKFAQTA